MYIPTLICSACMVLFPLALLLGGVAALPALLPPLRKAARGHPRVRKAMVVVLSLAALVAGYAGWARAYSGLNYMLAMEVYSAADCRQERCLRDIRTLYDNRDAVGEELWYRMMVPPPVRSRCYTGNADLCAMADETYWGAYPTHVTAGRDWGEYLSVLMFSLIPAVTTAVLVTRFTVPRRIEPLRDFSFAAGRDDATPR